MPPKSPSLANSPANSGAIYQSRVSPERGQKLIDEENVSLPQKIANSPLGTKLKRVDVGKFDFIMKREKPDASAIKKQRAQAQSEKFKNKSNQPNPALVAKRKGSIPAAKPMAPSAPPPQSNDEELLSSEPSKANTKAAGGQAPKPGNNPFDTLEEHQLPRVPAEDDVNAQSLPSTQPKETNPFNIADTQQKFDTTNPFNEDAVKQSDDPSQDPPALNPAYSGSAEQQPPFNPNARPQQFDKSNPFFEDQEDEAQLSDSTGIEEAPDGPNTSAAKPKEDPKFAAMRSEMDALDEWAQENVAPRQRDRTLSDASSLPSLDGDDEQPLALRSGNGADNVLLQDDPNLKPGSLDFKYQEITRFSHETKSRLGRVLGKRELMTKEQAIAQSHKRSAINRLSDKNQLAAKGVDENSPIARLNTRKRMTPAQRRDFFREKAASKGYTLIGDPGTTYDNLSLKDKLSIKWAELKHLVGANTARERGAIAVDWALDHAIGKSTQEHAEDRLKPVIANHGHGLTDSLAQAFDHSDAVRDESYVLTEAGIAEGKKKLLECLEMDPDETFTEDDKLKLANDFERWAREYNDLAQATNELRRERRHVMSGSVLEELGMPMLTMDELTRPEKGGEERFDKMFEEVEKEYLKEVGNGFGLSVKSFFVGLGVATGVVATGGLGLLAFSFKGVRRSFARALVDPKELQNRDSEVQRRYTERRHALLAEENRQAARSWVEKQYAFTEDDLNNPVKSGKMFDPNGFYAAMGNVTREEFVESLKTQLHLAAGAPPMIEERQVPVPGDPDYARYREYLDDHFGAGAPPPATLPPPPDGEVRDTPYDRYQHFLEDELHRPLVKRPPREGEPGYNRALAYEEMRGDVDAIAKGMFEGMVEGLHDTMNQQRALRIAADTTNMADNYVVSTNAAVRNNLHFAWHKVESMLSNLDDPAARADAKAAIDQCKDDLNGYLDEMDDTVDDEGTFALSETDDDDNPILVTLPQEGARRKLLRENIQAAQDDIAAAIETADKLETLIGDVGKDGSLSAIMADLDTGLNDTFWMANGLAGGDLAVNYDQLSAQLSAVKETAKSMKDQLPETAVLTLNQKIAEAETRLGAQQRMLQLVRGVEEELAQATRASQLTHENSNAANFDLDMRLEEDTLTAMEPPIGLNSEHDRQRLYAIRQGMQSKISGTREALQAKELVEEQVARTRVRLEKGEITLAAALNEVDQARLAADETLANLARRSDLPRDLVNRIHDIREDLVMQTASLVATALGVESDDGHLQLSPEAAKISANLVAAGQTGDAVIDAIKAQIKGDAPLQQQLVEEALLNVGSNAKQVREFANAAFDSRPELALSFKLAMLRQVGTPDDELTGEKMVHYGSVVSRMFNNALNPVNEAYKKAFHDGDLQYPNGVIDDDLDDDEARELQNQFDQEMRAVQIARVVALADQHPMLRAAGGKAWVEEAAGDLAKLIDPNNREMLDDEQISRAQTLAALLPFLGNDFSEIDATQKQFQKADAAQVSRQILSEFGLQADDIKDGSKMKDAATRALTSKESAPMMQEINRQTDAVVHLMSVQQQEAQLVKNAVIRPLEEFGELLVQKNKDGKMSADEVEQLMRSDKFTAKARVLQDVTRFLDADDQVIGKGHLAGQSDIHRANVQAMAALAVGVRGFKPGKLAGNRRFVNKLAMWWNEEKPKDVANQIRQAGGAEVADKYTKVWRHLQMLNALAESDADLSQDLSKLQEEHAELLSAVQQHREDQVVILAILEEFQASGQSFEQFDLNDEDVQSRIQARLFRWDQSHAWQGFAKRNDAFLKSGRLSPAIMHRWKSESGSLPKKLQQDFQRLSEALDGFRRMIGDAREAQAEVAGSPVDPAKAAAYNAEMENQVNDTSLAPKAGTVFNRMLFGPQADWVKSADWNGPTVNGAGVEEMRTMSTDEFTHAMKAGLANYQAAISKPNTALKVKGARQLSPQERAQDAAWVRNRQFPLIDKASEFNNRVSILLGNKNAGIPLDPAAVQKLKALGREIKEDARKLGPREEVHSKEKKHRYGKPVGAAKLRPQKSNHLLNRVDNSLHYGLPVMVDQQLARLGL